MSASPPKGGEYRIVEGRTPREPRDGFDNEATLAKRAESGVVSRAFDLVVVEEGREEVYRIDGSAPGPFLIGQSVTCQLRLNDRRVSRRHAALELNEGHLRFVDLGSTNGSFVGGARIVEALLEGGETLRIGDSTVHVQAVVAAAVAPLPNETRFGRVRGASPAMRRLYPVFARLAETKVPVVIEGETGTGKEALAESIHEEGPLKKAPFVVFDCTAVPPNLVESELFGHERGAFTGAVAQRRGLFEQAHRGTLLIDEIGDLDPALQPKLLRAIERGEIRRVGGSSPIFVDVRILAATRRNLDQEVARGRFRDDLFHRLAVTRIELPPLRKRKGDVALLARHFWEELGGSADDFPMDELSRWQDSEWPGNVRELRNTVARRLAMGTITLRPPAYDDPDAPETDKPASLDDVLEMDIPLPEARRILNERLEQLYVERMLARHQGVVSRAAEASGVARRHFQRIRAKGKKE
jgi:DNA-binding NtrC family response regulator